MNGCRSAANIANAALWSCSSGGGEGMRAFFTALIGVLSVGPDGRGVLEAGFVAVSAGWDEVISSVRIEPSGRAICVSDWCPSGFSERARIMASPGVTLRILPDM